MTRSGRVRIRLRCVSEQRCKGRLTLRTRGRVRVSKSRKAKRRKLTLGRRSFSIPAGKTRTVSVRLSRKNRRAVRRLKRVRTRVTATATGMKAARRTITLRAPKSKRARSRQR